MGAYVIISLAFGLALWRIEGIALDRACTNTSAIRAVAIDLTEPTPIPPDALPALRQTIEALNARDAAAREEILRRLDNQCLPRR